MGIGARQKLGPRFSLNGEYHHFLTPSFGDAFSPSLSLGVDIETGGHVFQLHVTNARGMFETVEINGEPLKIPAIMPKLSRTPGETHWPGAAIGEHNSEILGGLLGLSDKEIAEL